MNNRVKILVLAGGKGKRMQTELPKVLMRVKGKSMIERVLESVDKSGIDEKPTIFVSYKKELVMKELGGKYQYVSHDKQLGTGHAVKSAKKYLKGKARNIIVLYGDHPFVSSETIKKISEKHLRSGKKITMATVKLPDFEDWRANFANFSRIIRGKNGKIIKDVQFKDASDDEKKITEVNPCYFCFNALWLWKNIEKIKNNNAQKEYYLTDLIKMASGNDGIEVETVEIKPREALGANTKEELAILEKLAE